MTVSKEDRKAYENGREDAEFIEEHPVQHLFWGEPHGRPDEDRHPSESAAYDKGFKREQLDEDE